MVTASGRPQQRNVEVIKDDEIPSASNDHASHWRFFPARIRAVFAVRAAHEDLRGELP
jgi:hypothetical protein